MCFMCRGVTLQGSCSFIIVLEIVWLQKSAFVLICTHNKPVCLYTKIFVAVFEPSASSNLSVPLPFFFFLCLQASAVGAPEPGLGSRSQTPSSAVLHHAAEGGERPDDSGKCFRGNLSHQRGRGQEGRAGIVECKAGTSTHAKRKCCCHLCVMMFFFLPHLLSVHPFQSINKQNDGVLFGLCWKFCHKQNVMCQSGFTVRTNTFQPTADDLCHLLAKLRKWLTSFFGTWFDYVLKSSFNLRITFSTKAIVWSGRNPDYTDCCIYGNCLDPPSWNVLDWH